MYQDHGDGGTLHTLAQPLNIPTEREAKLQFLTNLCLAGAEQDSLDINSWGSRSWRNWWCRCSHYR